MESNRLFDLAPETVNVNASHVAGEGWRLTVTMRRQGEPWSSSYRAQYDRLTTPELADVIEMEIGRALLIV